MELQEIKLRTPHFIFFSLSGSWDIEMCQLAVTVSLKYDPHDACIHLPLSNKRDQPQSKPQ